MLRYAKAALLLFVLLLLLLVVVVVVVVVGFAAPRPPARAGTCQNHDTPISETGSTVLICLRTMLRCLTTKWVFKMLCCCSRYPVLHLKAQSIYVDT